jgi:SAM-dependent methyltransferase
VAGRQRQGNEVPSGIRADIPHPARVYDYYLGGKDNFAADRDAAEWALKLLPQLRDYARGNRTFMVRATRFLRKAGVRQFLDIGSGFPTSPNVHEIAQEDDPSSRVVYVDNDPMVFMHAEALMAKNAATEVVLADLRDEETVLGEARKLLDFTQPVALLFVACLHHIPDEDDPAGIVARYLQHVAPGSYLVLSHYTDEFAPERVRAHEEEARRRHSSVTGRSKEAITAMFNGSELLDPGLVLVNYWRPAVEPGPNAGRAWAYGGVALL